MSLLSPQLLAFIAVAECQTVHAAAERLHLTQTAVTQRIRSLERTLCTTLFIRSRKGMRLTDQAEALLRYCRATQMLEGETLAAIQTPGSQSNASCKLCAPSSMMRNRITVGCVPIMKRFAHLQLQFVIEDNETRHHLLKSGKTDIAIIEPQHLEAQMQSKTLTPEEYILVAPAGWKKRPLQSILSTERIIDFNENDNASLRYLEHYSLETTPRPQRYFINDTQQIAFLIEKGIGYSCLTKEVAAPYLRRKTMITLNKGRLHSHQYVLAWYNRVEAPEYFNAIIDAIN